MLTDENYLEFSFWNISKTELKKIVKEFAMERSKNKRHTGQRVICILNFTIKFQKFGLVFNELIRIISAMDLLIFKLIPSIPSLVFPDLTWG